MQTPIAEAPTDRGQLPQPRPDHPIIRPTAPVTHRTAVAPDHRARPPLAHLPGLAQMSDGLSSGDGRHHFFEAMSFSIALSSIASASSFFSLAFSS
jgi:hypothetical protein